GAVDTDLSALDDAAHRIAVAENTAVFHGLEEAGIRGIAEASAHDPIPLGDDVKAFPRRVAQALELLRNAGIGGPYGLALGPHAYTAAIEVVELSGLVVDHLGEMLEGPVVWAPGVRGGVVLSQRGDDFLLGVGQDLSIGYDHHACAQPRRHAPAWLHIPHVPHHQRPAFLRAHGAGVHVSVIPPERLDDAREAFAGHQLQDHARRLRLGGGRAYETGHPLTAHRV